MEYKHSVRVLMAGAGLLMSVAMATSSATAADDINFEAPMAPATDWSGFYAGFQLGGASLESNSSAATLIQPDSGGVVGGIHAGYNFQFDNFVLGVEGDLLATDLSDTTSCFNPVFNCEAGADWMGSARVRAGMTFGQALVYATGGVAVLGYEGSTFQTATSTLFEDSTTFTGWTAGGGVEYAWGTNKIIGIEARYSDFGTKTLQYDIPYEVSPEVFSVTARLSFKFGQ